MEKKVYVCQLSEENKIEYVLARDEKEALKISRGIKVLATHGVADWSENEPKYQKYYKKYFKKEK